MVGLSSAWEGAGNHFHCGFGTFLLRMCQDGSFLLVTPALPRSLLDVNECITGSHSCRLGESCINTVGSFRCQRDSSCGTGYELTEDNSCKGTARAPSPQTWSPSCRYGAVGRAALGSGLPQSCALCGCLGDCLLICGREVVIPTRVSGRVGWKVKVLASNVQNTEKVDSSAPVPVSSAIRKRFTFLQCGVNDGRFGFLKRLSA